MVQSEVERWRRWLREHGGFTVEMGSGRPVEHGVAVGAAPAWSVSFRLEAWDDARVAAWSRAVRAWARGGDRPGLHLGGWCSAGEVHLDVVRVLATDRHVDARSLGRRHGQRAMFDLSTRELVPLQVAP